MPHLLLPLLHAAGDCIVAEIRGDMRRFVLGWKKLGLERSLGTRLVTYADDAGVSDLGGVRRNDPGHKNGRPV
jgi:hypothetical protein